MFHWPHRSAVGLDISDRSLEAILLRRRLGRPIVAAASRLELPAGVVEDGNIRQPTVLADHLRRLLHQATPQPIAERSCLLSLPESQIYSHRFTLPAALDVPQVRQAVLYDAEQFVPIPLRESYYDFTVVGSQGEEQQIVYVATRRELVHQYLEVCRAAGLLPLAFEPEATSICRALLRRGVGDRGPVLLLDVGARTTNAYLVVHGTPVVSLTIPRAGDHLTAVLSDELKLSPAAAEEHKRRYGLRGEPPARMGGVPASGAATLLRALGPLVGELKRFAEYGRQHGGWYVKRVVLAGGTVLLPGFAEYLSAQLSLPVAVGNPVERVSAPRESFPRQAVLYADVIGLALRGLSRDPAHAGLNLLAQAQGQLRRQLAQRWLSLPKFDRRLAALLTSFGLSVAALLTLLVYRRHAAPPAPPALPPLVDWSAVLAPREHRLRFAFVPVGAPVPAGFLPARRLEAATHVAGDFTAQGTTTVTTAGTVAVRLVNTTLQPRGLAKGVRLQAAAGAVTLRVAHAVTVPAEGTVVVEVPVPAAVPALPAGKLTLPGLPSTLRSQVYGELSEPYQAVVNTVSAVGAEDLAAARRVLAERAQRQAREQLVPQLTADEFLVPALAAADPPTVVAQPPPGVPAERWRATYDVRLHAAATPRRELERAIQAALGLGEEPLKAVSFEAAAVDLEQKQFSVTIKTSQLPVEK